ncbi:hypothetical protein ACLOJK_024776 [Asimina triloba]
MQSGLLFFDTAAIVTQPGPPNLWRIATVHRVEELKSIIRMIPISSVGILLVTASSHQLTFAIQQAKTMDRHHVHLHRLFVPLTRRVSGITHLKRMGIGGLAINILSTATAAMVEVKRKDAAARHGMINDPHAVMVIPRHLEFLYDQASESMRSSAAALYWLAIAVGNYLSTLLVALIHRYTAKSENWLPDKNLNYYYWSVNASQVLDLAYYVVCAWFYTHKPLVVVEAADCPPPPPRVRM